MVYLYVVTKFINIGSFSVHTYSTKNMLFELALPFSSAQGIRVCENNKVWEWNLWNFKKYIRLPVKLNPLDKNTLYTSGTFCSILEKQQKIKCCESVLFCNLLRYVKYQFTIQLEQVDILMHTECCPMCTSKLIVVETCTKISLNHSF